MARYQVILAYEGTQFFGSQRQAKARTVQGELEKALRTLGWTGGSILMAGRTDTGVHASGQVAAFDLDWNHPEAALLRALNANLPADVAVQKIQSATPDFHPRFDARSRLYRYRLFCQQVRDPLRERHAWRVWPEFKGDILQTVALKFLGKHDFRAFGTPPRLGGSSVRTVMKIGWKNREDEWTFEVQADAFLYRMVRRLVFVQVAVSQGTLAASNIEQWLVGQEKGLHGYVLPSGLAPAQGLTLVEVTY